MTVPDRVDLALRLGRAVQTITAIETIAARHERLAALKTVEQTAISGPVMVPAFTVATEIRDAIRDPFNHALTSTNGKMITNEDSPRKALEAPTEGLTRTDFRGVE